jgi:hypothetical protein
MAKIINCDLADVLPSLESITVLEPRSLAANTPEDLFLCALGFEPRCLTLPSMLNAAGYKARRVTYFKYATNLDDNAVNLPEMERHLRGIATNVQPIEADGPDFPGRFRALLELVISEGPSKPPWITLDVSVMANRFLLRCMKVLLGYDICARIIYSEAAVYHPTKEEYGQDPAKWENEDLLGLERGVSDVMPSIDHPGHALDPLPDCVILFPSFKAERSKAVISFVDPSLLSGPSEKVVWLLGVPHLGEDRWRLEAMKRINAIGQEERQYEVDTFDYRETLRILESLHGELAERYRITISPLGSKMQALGTALFCYMHPDVRIIFSTPKEYNAAQYSKGCKATWKIGFGRLADLCHRLDRVGALRVDE